jgi:hypothetical protein
MSITPKQAFEAAKVLWPEVRRIERNGEDGWLVVGANRGNIDWGETDQYPLPEPEWVDAVFPQDVGKQGRFSRDIDGPWVHGQIRGQWEGEKWINGFCTFKFCQVQKVKT